MESERTIPILPCASITEMLDFYVMLGFEITYRQERPNTMACVKRGGIELHFFSMKGYEPANSYSTCAVMVPEVDALYKDYTTRMRQRYGKVLTVGIPRFTALRDKSGNTRGFNVIDPGGNWIRIYQYMGAPEGADETEGKKDKTPRLEKAWRVAEVLADAAQPDIAAKTLDRALAESEDATAIDRVHALVVRANLALTLDDPTLARRMVEEARAVPLTEEERVVLAEEFQRAADVEGMLVN